MSASIEDVIGYRFRDAGLLREALTHKSHAFEKGIARHNERLEFLGDSVLAAVAAHRLFERYPDCDEGRLSKMKASLVSRATCAQLAQELDLGRFLLLGSGEEATGGRQRPSILSNALEAVIGAVYLDGGFDAARRVVVAHFPDFGEGFEETDYKSRLQEIVQKRHKVPPSYRLVKTTGPDHDKTFAVRVQLGSRTLGSGNGKTKKEAEQVAARDALRKLARRGPAAPEAGDLAGREEGRETREDQRDQS
jgi:ribonuclease-3